MNSNVMMSIEEYERLLASPRAFIEAFCYITTKDGNFELMKINYPQDKLMKIVEKCLAERRPIRVRVLKARQMGFSTLISALGFWWAAMNENSAYAVVAHKETSASSIFEKNKIFYENLPKPLRPQTNKFNSEKISFNTSGFGDYEVVKGLRSKIFFGTAGGGELFRGETILFLHKSEVAFWDDKFGILKKSLNATVPDSPFTAIIEETTANGYNEFKDDWDSDDDYDKLFVGWQEMPGYKKTPPSDFELTEKELMLQMEYDLTDAQLFWRRHKIKNDYSGNALWFQQEYPLTPAEAFIASGFGVFDHEVIEEGYRKCRKPIREQAIESEIVRAKLEIWEEPEVRTEIEYEQLVRFSVEKQKYEYYDGTLETAKKTVYANYTVGVDTSGMGADWNHVVVWHNIKKIMVAKVSLKNINEERLAKIIVEVAKFYFDALVAVETNYSHALYDYMIALGYKNFYFTENYARVDKKKEALEYGWQTTKASKGALISTFRAYLNENPGAVPDKAFWYEVEYYLMEDAVKYIMNAAAGHFDDLIMANAIAFIVSCSFQSKQLYTTKTKRFEDKMKKNDIMFIGQENLTKNKTSKLRKGVYNNNA